ncbi:MAG: isoleucine--tRNA ligase [Candidatus Neomarinimicrobiota bacterium]
MEKNYQPVIPKVDFVRQELEILDWWASNRIFEQLVARNQGHPRWSFLDGPITANNPMGVHHAWGRTLKDVFNRYHAMLGHELRYQNGFDCQGLWVEVEVERNLGFTSKKDIEKFGVEKFVELCKERVRKYAAILTQQSIRLGYWMDWENSYFTMSDENNYTIWHFLKKVHEKGWLRKGEDSMPWCPRCGTGLSQHEMSEGYREIDDKSVFVALPLDGREGEYLLVWTTTPWTLPANVAAAVAVDRDYVGIEADGSIFYLMPEAVRRTFGRKYEPKIVRRLKGAEMIGWTYRGPFDELPAVAGVEHRVIAWAEVSTEEGTGIVHIAPGCGKEDFELGREYGLGLIRPIDEAGIYVEGFDWLTGQSAHEVAAGVIGNLKEKQLLIRQESYRHRYPHCWRCKTKLVYRTVTAWYIVMDELRYQIMEVAKQIHWMPAFGLGQELDWLQNMSDWMISKKRYWGLALPIYECANCNTVTVIGSRDELEEKAVNGWEDFDGHSPHRPWVDAVKIACGKCGREVSRIADVGNPWLDAGIVSFSTMHYNDDREYWEKWFPADFITESFPGQYRHWFYSLLAMSTVLENKPPFKLVLGHGLVKDAYGKDMHKSEGNAIWFDEAAEKMGVDVMRWMYAAQNPEHNLLFGYDAADEVRKKLLTFWNSYSFFVTYASLDKFDPRRHGVPHEERPEIDRWMTARTQKLVRIAHEHYSAFRTDRLMRAVDGYLEALSNWYIRRNRRRFWKSENDQDKFAAYCTLHESLVTFAQVAAPISPFITEAIYRNLVCSLDPQAPESVHLCPFPEYQAALVDEDLIREIDTLVQVVALARSARNKANLKIRQPLDEVLVSAEPAIIAALKKNESQLLDELNIKVLRTGIAAEELVSYEIKPNPAVLGPRLGKQMGQVSQALATHDQSAMLTKWRQKEPFTLETEAGAVTLEPEEIIVTEKAIPPYAVASSREVLVGINTTLSPELIEEGTVRDLIRQVQNMRKEADLKVEERIQVGITGDAHVTQSLGRFQDYFLTEVLGTRLVKNLERPIHQKVVNLNGADVSIYIARAVI